MKRFALVLAATLCFLLITATGHPLAAKDSWTSVRSKNFLLIGNGGEKEIKKVAVRLEQFREVFSRLLPKLNFNSPVPTTVIVFKNDSSYRPFKPNATTAGYFQSGPDVNYITLTTELHGEQDPFTVIFHEFTHLLVNNTMGNMPLWFNEGLAEYYSSFSITDDRKVMMGKPISSHVYLLRDNKMLPLRTLFQVDQKSKYYNEREKQSIFYAESWALMHYLILGNKGQYLPQLSRFIQLMDTNVPMEQAFPQAFQTSFENMEKELREYIKRSSYPVITGEFGNKVGFDAEMQTAPITEAESQAYLGDLLLHSNRQESEAYLQRALALDPQQAMANAAMGMLLVRQGKIDLARQSLERAVAANSTNYLIHYYYAYALSREGMTDAHIVQSYSPELAVRLRGELTKAIALRPDYPESYNLLAFVNLVTNSQIDESTASLKRLLATSPGRNDIVYTLAQLYIRKEDFKSARQLAERLSQNNSDANVRQEGQRLIAMLTERDEMIARNRAITSANDAPPPLRRNTSTGTTDETAAPTVTPVSPFSYLQDALREPGDGEKRIQGTLIRIDCDARGITFIVKVEERLVKLHTDKFENIQIVAFTQEVKGDITCGLRKPENAIVVCYVPATDSRAKFDGAIKSLEFVPKDFKLKIRA